jgi:alpha-L-fucosidase
MKRYSLLGTTLFVLAVSGPAAFAAEAIPVTAVPTVIVSTAAEPVTAGKFQPTWESLKQYQVPEWFRDAKFGIWACFGPQNQPEMGDWYGRNMYHEGSRQYKFHAAHYGPPSQFGFKDVINVWKAEKWDPERLVALYKRTGAQYFFAMANHHDNLDLYDSKYQPWNSVRVGPKQDIIGGFAKAARAQNLPFGVSVHAAHAWIWYESTLRADSSGPLAGVTYDGKLTKADGKGQWWEGLDPQDLYEQRHQPSAGFDKPATIHTQWDYQNGASIPDLAFCERFYNRTVDLVHKYKPDLLYFDDDALPLWPVSDAGLKIAADFYNFNMKVHGGKLTAVLFGKQLGEEQRKCLVWDIERGAANRIEPFPWQTDTCIGNWHYERSLYEKNTYKSAATVIHMLADIVAKNGNLLLNIPVRGDGSLDDKEEAILEGIAAWMQVNRECIFGTRPWKVFGEGPASAGAALTAQGFNEGKGKPFTAEDVRFTKKGSALYAILLGAPTREVTIKSLGTTARLLDQPVRDVTLLGSKEKLTWKQGADSLVIQPVAAWPSETAVVFLVTL